MIPERIIFVSRGITIYEIQPSHLPSQPEMSRDGIFPTGPVSEIVFCIQWQVCYQIRVLQRPPIRTTLGLMTSQYLPFLDSMTMRESVPIGAGKPLLHVASEALVRE